jgi:hypothetical protein
MKRTSFNLLARAFDVVVATAALSIFEFRTRLVDQWEKLLSGGLDGMQPITRFDQILCSSSMNKLRN